MLSICNYLIVINPNLRAMRTEVVGYPVQKIVITTEKATKIIRVDTVMYCEAKGNYTCLYLKNGEKVLVARSMRELGAKLEENNFYKLDKQVTVNLDFISEVQQDKNLTIIMVDGALFTLPLRKAKKFQKVYSNS